MTFAFPPVLFALAAVPLLAWFLWWSQARTKRRLAQFAAHDLVATLTASFSPVKYAWKSALLCLALAGVIVAMARPQLGYILEESEGRGIDVLIALDTSRSMLAEDVRPNRLERAKLAILDLLPELEGNRVGLIAFAGTAFLQCPLTLDFNAFQDTLDAIDTELIPRGGTDLAAAIREAQATFPEGDEAFKFLIMITDGEDLEAAALQQARDAAEAGMRVFTVGVGSAEGTPIPVMQPNGQTAFLRDANGEVVLSRLDEATLLAVAAATGGAYAELGATGAGLREVYDAGRTAIPERDLGTRIQQVPIERFQWPLVFALLCLAAERLLTTRRKLMPAGNAVAAGILLGLGSLFLASPSDANPIREGKALYQAGDYIASAEAYARAIEEDPADAELQYNRGVSLYRAGSFGPAADAFRAALTTDNPALQQKVFFNLGNSLYQLGEARMDDDPVIGRSLWEEAVQAYRNAQQLDVDDAEAARNEAFVQQEIVNLVRTLTVMITPPEGGTVEGSEGNFVRGQTVELTAKPSDGWRFGQWQHPTVTEETAESPTFSLKLTADDEVAAAFVKTWNLTVTSADEAMGSAGESGTIDAETPSPIQAEAIDYFAFKRWVTDNDTVTLENAEAAETNVTLTGDGAVRAEFVPAFKLEVLSDPEIAGNVGQTGFYEEFSEVPIQAAAREGFSWVGWLGTGPMDPTAEQTSLMLTEDRVVTAKFQREYNLVVLPQTDQMGTTTGGGNYPVGELVPITATANEGFEFMRWEGPGVSLPEEAETFVTVQEGEHDVIAIFEQSENENEDSEDSQDQQDEQEQDQEQNDSESDSEENPEQNESEEEQSPEEQEPEEQEEEQPEEEQGQEEQPEPTEPEETQPQPLNPEDISQEEARLLLAPLRQNPKVLPQTEREGEIAPSGQGRDW